MMFLGILGIVAWVAFAFWPAFIAKSKGYSFGLFLLLGILTSFLIALIIAAVLKDKTETSQDRADDAAAERALRHDEEAR